MMTRRKWSSSMRSTRKIVTKTIIKVEMNTAGDANVPNLYLMAGTQGENTALRDYCHSLTNIGEE